MMLARLIDAIKKYIVNIGKQNFTQNERITIQRVRKNFDRYTARQDDRICEFYC